MKTMGCRVCVEMRRPGVFSLPSPGLRSSGRTQKQVLDHVKEGGHKKVQFER